MYISDNVLRNAQDYVYKFAKLHCIIIAVVMRATTVYCKLFAVENFHGFHGSIGSHETFPVK